MTLHFYCSPRLQYQNSLLLIVFYFGFQSCQLRRIRHSQKRSRHSPAARRTHEPRLLGGARGFPAGTIFDGGRKDGPKTGALYAIRSRPANVSRRSPCRKRILLIFRFSFTRFRFEEPSGGLTTRSSGCCRGYRHPHRL